MRGFNAIVLCVLFAVFGVVSVMFLVMTYYEFTVDVLVSFENLTTSIFEEYNVTGDARRLYNDVVLVSLKGFVNLMFLLIVLALFICLILVLIEVRYDV
jgi:hypothetical protein